MRTDVRTVIFSAVFGTICALILTAVGRLTAPYRTVNEKAEEMRNYLAALDVPISQEALPSELIGVFDRNVQISTKGDLTLYAYIPEGKTEPEAFAVPVSGMGLWGPVKGVLALQPDLTTIRGLRFYQQEETPGLGGEIGADWFTAQFTGKKIVAADGKPSFKLIKKGEPGNENSVDAITGATMTSDRVETLLRDVAGKIATERKSRHGLN